MIKSMNRRLVVSILAMILVLTMILSLVLAVIPVSAEGLEQCPYKEIAMEQYADKNLN